MPEERTYSLDLLAGTARKISIGRPLKLSDFREVVPGIMAICGDDGEVIGAFSVQNFISIVRPAPQQETPHA